MLRRVLCLFLAGAALSIPPLPPFAPFASLALADAKSVFAEASPSIIVVLAQNSAGEQQAQGSGVVIAKGIAITNCHVIEDAAKVQLRQAADSRGAESYRMDAEVVAKDEDKDLCLLYAADLSAPPAAKSATMGAAKALTIGEEVYALGAPQGLDLSLSRGIVAQLRGVKGKAPVIQTDAAISPGSSGGGLFNDKAELVGITSFQYGDGLTFAIPAENAAALLEVAHQKIALATKWQTCTDNPKYQCILDLAIQTARQINDNGILLGYIAGTQAAIGDINGAKQTAQQISDDANRSRAFLDIATAQAKWGDIDGAKEIARQIDNAFFRVASLLDIAKVQAQVGEVNSARQTADNAKKITQKIDNVHYHSNMLLHIAEFQFKLNDINDAKQTFVDAINLVQQDTHRGDETLSKIAEAQAKLGDISGAKQTTQKINASGYRSVSLNNIARVQAEMGDIDGAKQTAQQIRFVACDKRSFLDERRLAFLDIAGAQAASGDTSGAMQTARQVSDCRPFSFALKQIAIAQAEAGDVSGAIQTALKTDRDGFVLQYIAIAQAKSGDIRSAKQTAEQIEIDYSGLLDIRSGAFSRIAELQAESGDISGAMQTIQKIRGAGLNIRVLEAIAVAQAESGDIASAMQTAKIIGDSPTQVRSLANIAKILAVW